MRSYPQLPNETASPAPHILAPKPSAAPRGGFGRRDDRNESYNESYAEGD